MSFQNINSYKYSYLDEDFIDLVLLSDINQKSFQQNYDQFIIASIQDQVKQVKEAHHYSKSPTQNYHNFQKHLIITLKKVIDDKQISHQEQTKQIQKELWKKFKTSSRKTKLLISLTFGHQERKEMIDRYGYQNIYFQNPIDLVRKAKQNIRKQIIKQINNMDLQQMLQKRKINHKEIFIYYLRSFIQKLSKKRFEKRFRKYCLRYEQYRQISYL